MMVVHDLKKPSVKTFIIVLKTGEMIHVSATSFALSMENVYRFFMEPIDEISKKINKGLYCRVVFEIKAKEVFSVGEKGSAKFIKPKQGNKK